ncbi:hypothetical protein [Faecalispora jeddahensis]|uniref:hypothetical protein n=1 Tax=Faecalispora jeddahensis TaxID=1414721 RepID=UPI0004AE1982|nr:hypothetical protein [Faecalispora jeddahensis]
MPNKEAAQEYIPHSEHFDAGQCNFSRNREVSSFFKRGLNKNRQPPKMAATLG